MSAIKARVLEHVASQYKAKSTDPNEVDFPLPIINAPELPKFSLKPEDKQGEFRVLKLANRSF